MKTSGLFGMLAGMAAAYMGGRQPSPQRVMEEQQRQRPSRRAGRQRAALHVMAQASCKSARARGQTSNALRDFRAATPPQRPPVGTRCPACLTRDPRIEHVTE